MIRLRSMDLSGFRGSRHSVPLDFTPKAKSMAIFGENATGKSSFADAIEWFFYDRVDSLWKEDCKAEALRNVAIADTESSIVSLRFTEDKLSCEKVLTSELKIKESNKTDEFQKFKDQVTNERIVLRTSDLTEFIKKPKGEKRKELASIIGFQALTDFRTTILAILNHLEKHPDYLGAKKSKEQAQARLLTIAGSIIDTGTKLYKKANELVKAFSLKTEIKDHESYKKAIKELTDKISQQDKAEKRLKLIETQKLASNLRLAINEERASEKEFIGEYKSLLKNKEKLKMLDLEQFLSKGKVLLDKEWSQPNKCPFCGEKVNFAHLKEEVTKRIQELKSIKEELEILSPKKDDWASSINKIRTLSDALEARKEETDLGAEVLQSLNDLKHACKSFPKEIVRAFSEYIEIKAPEGWAASTTKLSTSLKKRIDKAEDEIKVLALTKEEEKLLKAIQALNDLSSAFSDYKQNRKAQTSFETQIKTIVGIKDEFIKRQNDEFQNVLDIMSDDIGKYYLFLHPPEDENVKSVKLRMVDEEGVEFEYIFHGKPAHPPLKYLSESHLNSLGIALFLASVKIFNKESQFFVLDDVVTSFDTAHRRRLLRLLDEQFCDWQILLLTHEQLWFELIKKELVPSGWIMREVQWTLENGIQVTPSPETLRELIALKRSKKFDVSNDLRTLSESILKEICYHLEVKLMFRYNPKNEDRMAGELLNELRRTLKEKNAGLENDPIFKRMEGSGLLATKGSHDSTLKSGSGDIDVILQDLNDLENLFKCSKNHYVARENKVPGEDKITCKCGERALAWKN